MTATMRKCFVLLLTMVVSIGMLCIPALAAYDSVPYFFNDYETSFKGVYGADEENITIANGGVAGSGKCLKITDEGAIYADRVIVNKNGSAISGAVSDDCVIKISFYIKITQALSAGNVMFLVASDAGTFYPAVSFDSKNTTDWQKVSLTAALPEETTKINSIKFRFGSHGSSTDLVDGDTTGLARDFYLDDFTIEFSKEKKADQIANVDNYYASFEGDVAPFGIHQAGYWNVTKTPRDNSAYIARLVSNPCGSGQVVKVIMADDAGHGNEFYISNNLNTGTYSAGYTPVGTIPAGSTVTLRFKYYLETELSSDTVFGFSGMLYGGSGYYLSGTDFDTTPNQWNIATLTYTNNTGNPIVMPSNVKTMPLRPAINYTGGPTCKAATLSDGETKYGTRIIYFDDLEMFVTSEGEDVPDVLTSATSADLNVNGNIIAGNAVSFSHRFIASNTSGAGVEDMSVIRLMNVTSSGEVASLASCGINESMIIPATLTDSVSKYFEVVPIGSDGTVGEVVTYTVDAEHMMAQLGDSVVVHAVADITDAYMIFASYTSTGQLADYEIKSVTVAADETCRYSLDDLQLADYTRVMLWENLSTCKPLAKAIDYASENIYQKWGDFEESAYWDDIIWKFYLEGEAEKKFVEGGADGTDYSLYVSHQSDARKDLKILTSLAPEETYYLSCYVKTDSPDVTSVKLITEYTADGNATIGEYAIGSEWTKISCAFTVPTGKNVRRLVFRFGDGSADYISYLDELCVIAKGDVSDADYAVIDIMDIATDDGVEVVAPVEPQDDTNAVNIYVDAASGNDENPGTESSPLASIEAARDMAKIYAPDMQNHIYIRIRGEQYLEDTFRLDETDSGQNGYKIVYTSWGEEKATLTMAKKFTGFEEHDKDKNIWKLHIGEGVSARQVYFNDVRGIRSRTVGYLKNPDYILDSHFLCDNEELLNLAYPSDVEAVFNFHWMQQLYGVSGISEEDGRIRIDLNNYFKYYHNYINAYGGTDNMLYSTPSYLENAYEFLDQSGEWYINEYDNYLYYIPREGENMDTLECKIPIGNQLVNVSGSSYSSPASHIAFDNLIFEGTDWKRADRVGGFVSVQNNVCMDGLNGAHDEGAVHFDAVRYIDFTNCDIRHTGQGSAALMFYRGCKNVNVVGNEIYQTAGVGLMIDAIAENIDRGGYRPQERNPKEYTENFYIANNYIHSNSWVYQGGAQVGMGHPRHVLFTHNEIANAPYSGIHIGWGWTNALADTGSVMYDVEISNNYIHDVMMGRVYDGAAIYTLGASSLECDQTTTGTENKNRIIGNYLANGWKCDYIYHDSGTTSWYAAENVANRGYVEEHESNFVHNPKPRNQQYWSHAYHRTACWITHENNYATDDYAYNVNLMGASESYFDPVTIVSNHNSMDSWPAEARAIMTSAGIEDEYKANFNTAGAKIFNSNDRIQIVPVDTPTDSGMMILGDNNTKFDLSDYEIHWWCSEPGAVTLDANGVMTAHKEGIFEVEAAALVDGMWQHQHFMIEAIEKTEQIANMDGYFANYEGDVAPLGIYSDGYLNTTTEVRDNGNITSQLVANPDGVGQVVKIVIGDQTGHASAEMFVSNNTGIGKYDAGYTPTGTIPVGGTLTIRFKYYLETPLSNATSFGFSGSICNNKYVLGGTTFDSTPNKWHYATITYKNETGSDIVIPEGVNPIRIRPTKQFHGGANWTAATLSEGETLYGTRTVYIDEMQMFIKE